MIATPLDRDTCEAIAAEFHKRKSDYVNRVGELAAGTIANWAEQIVRDMASPPEPPATPSAGAMRAEQTIIAIQPTVSIGGEKGPPWWQPGELAAIIDREACLPELVAVCEKAADIRPDLHRQHPDAPGCLKVQAANEELCDLEREAKAALAKYGGVTDE